jgi:hypothetical protein
LINGRAQRNRERDSLDLSSSDSNSDTDSEYEDWKEWKDAYATDPYYKALNSAQQRRFISRRRKAALKQVEEERAGRAG